MASLLIPIVAALKMMSVPASASPSANQAPAQVRVAQASASPAASAPSPAAVAAAGRTTQSASVRLSSAQKQQAALEVQMAGLRKTYNEQLGEVDRLKAARASWRRDRQLREQKAKSQKTAMALQKLERSLRDQRSVVSRERKALAQAIDSELALGASAARQRSLHTMLSSLRSTLRKAPKKISIPDLELNEYADPEELLEQIALIERAEAKLVAEEDSLDRRAEHYAHMDTLRRKRTRADEMGALDDEGVRRSTGRVASAKDSRTASEDGNGAGGADLAGLEPSTDQGAPPPSGPEAGGGGDFASTSIVLADVVDAGTQDALRRADRSSSPRTKAEAAKLATKQVRDKLERLRASKERIRRHLQKLKK